MLSSYQDIPGGIIDADHLVGLYSDLGVTAMTEGGYIRQWTNALGNPFLSASSADTTKFIYSTSGPAGVRVIAPFAVGTTQTNRSMTVSGLSYNSQNNTQLWVGRLHYLGAPIGALNVITLPQGGAGALSANVGQLVVSGPANPYTGLRPFTSRVCAIVGVSKTTGFETYLNKPSSKSVVPPVNNLTLTTYGLGHPGALSGHSHARSFVWNRALTDAEVAQVLEKAVYDYAITDPTEVGHWFGDSRVVGFYSTKSYSFATRERLGAGKRWGFKNYALGGKSAFIAAGAGEGSFDNVMSGDADLNSSSWLFLVFGVNDFLIPRTAAQIWGDVQTVINKAVAKGVQRSRIVVCTEPAKTQGFPASLRDDLNALLRAGVGTVFGRLVDLAANAFIGPNGEANYPGNFANTFHFNDNGDAIVGQLFNDAVPELDPIANGSVYDIGEAIESPDAEAIDDLGTAVVAVGSAVSAVGTVATRIKNLEEADTYIDKTTTPWKMKFMLAGTGGPGTGTELMSKTIRDVDGGALSDMDTIPGRLVTEPEPGPTP